jgi:acetyl-CoA carboxylase biotin carboxylase subunit
MAPKRKRIKKLLVANRGEIAGRIIRSAKEMGIATVAVHSDVDALAPFVALADEVFAIGGESSASSYLRMENIIEAAKRTHADAIHPGYGFLSENADFAELVAAEGLIFIGPYPEAMRLLGNKVAARQVAKSLGVPMVPGVVDQVATYEAALVIAGEIGFPVLIKAAAGGGGKGMRVVRNADELPGLYATARSEAKSAFGDDSVYIEKYVEEPRHIEVQILADAYGNVVHLGERECSIQRRHQKLVEESPSPIVTPDLRHRITSCAVLLASETHYRNAGTVEFLVDKHGNYYFLEVNARLQVEHPVTEMRTGIDLVYEQIRIAEGERLPWKQEEIVFSGASIECRICAEDAHNNFFPSTGTIHWLRSPQGPHTREDRGIELGSEVTPYYDPLLSKLICWGQTRDEVLRRISRALDEMEIYGVRTNIDLLKWIVDHPDFRAGNFSTSFLDREFNPEKLTTADGDELTLAALAAVSEFKNRSLNGAANSPKPLTGSKWTEKRAENLR